MQNRTFSPPLPLFFLGLSGAGEASFFSLPFSDTLARFFLSFPARVRKAFLLFFFSSFFGVLLPEVKSSSFFWRPLLSFLSLRMSFEIEARCSPSLFFLSCRRADVAGKWPGNPALFFLFLPPVFFFSPLRTCHVGAKRSTFSPRFLFCLDLERMHLRRSVFPSAATSRLCPPPFLPAQPKRKTSPRPPFFFFPPPEQPVKQAGARCVFSSFPGKLSGRPLLIFQVMESRHFFFCSAW